MASNSVGDIVADIRSPHRVVIGTVIGTVGGPYTDTAVHVYWHHLGYSHWETPGNLSTVHTGTRAVRVFSGP
jgi:hypothetical protein